MQRPLRFMPIVNADTYRRGLGLWHCAEQAVSNPIFRAAIAASLALAVSFSAWADFTGKVVGVADGDSITVLRDREQVKVRLVDIDAPEKGQAFGNRSKQALEALVKGQEVLVVERGKDRYQRTLGRIYRGDLDVNAEQVRQGMAWVIRQYAKDATLYPIEAEAKEQKRGLWRDPEPVPPWEWRKAQTKGSSRGERIGDDSWNGDGAPLPPQRRSRDGHAAMTEASREPRRRATSRLSVSAYRAVACVGHGLRSVATAVCSLVPSHL